MKILGIEASAKVASAALLSDGVIISEKSTNGPMTHSQTLMPMVDDVLRAVNADGHDLDMIAVTEGPGSFTGLRIGAATAKGLSIGYDVPVMPLSTLEALAYNLVGMQGLIVPVMDARRKQIYTAVYQSTEGELHVLKEPDAIPAADMVRFLLMQCGKIHLLGDSSVVEAADRFQEIASRCIIAGPHQACLRAASVCALAAWKYAAGVRPVASDAWSIEYLRKPQAEREREAKLRAEGTL